LNFRRLDVTNMPCYRENRSVARLDVEDGETIVLPETEFIERLEAHYGTWLVNVEASISWWNGEGRHTGLTNPPPMEAYYDLECRHCDEVNHCLLPIMGMDRWVSGGWAEVTQLLQCEHCHESLRGTIGQLSPLPDLLPLGSYAPL
jgi:hypothetical protein